MGGNSPWRKGGKAKGLALWTPRACPVPDRDEDPVSLLHLGNGAAMRNVPQERVWEPQES